MQIEHSLEEKEIFLRSNRFRGLLAIVVMLSHIWGYTGLIFLVPFNKVVTIAVFIFFLLSGYGMMRSAQKKDRYTRGIFLQKIPFLLFMALTSYLISLAMQFFTHVTNDYGLDLIPVGIKGFFLSTNWYVYELIGFYLLFAISGLLKKPVYRVVFVFICSIIGFVVLFNSGLVEAYYNSIFGFSAGMLLGICDYTKILEEKKHGYIIGIIILLVAFALMFVLNKDTIVFALVRNVAAVGAVIILLYLCTYLNLSARVNECFCRLSPEIYFYHMPVALVLSRLVTDPYKFTAAVIAASLLLAVIFNVVDNKVNKFWKGLFREGE